MQEKTIMPRRVLGRTGEKLSQLGFGGILVMDVEQKRADNMVARAFDHGINYYDVAPTYGNAELQLGPALEPYRKQSFLACKTGQRDKKGALEELHASLKHMRTDYFDLYQLHHITTEEDVERAFAPDGAMETFIQAKKDGKVRYLGFSAHSEKAALMAMQRYDFDTILFPINFVCWFEGNFGPRVLKEAKKTDKGILALKGLAFRQLHEDETQPYPKCWYMPIPEKEDRMAEIAFRFTYEQGITAAIPPGSPVFWDRAFQIAANLKPVTDNELQELKEYASGKTPCFNGYENLF
ncbi:MAG: aldo/keto reductase [candidate division KSB1 bacterium]|nr:aldo/keto reductase [candidate division KSB1 bacterium]